MTGLLVPTARRHARGTGVSSAFGTFGELIQGRDVYGVDFLTTLPIALWSTATVTTDPFMPGLRVRPAHKHKAARLARAVLSSYGYTGGGTITVTSAIPEGKGLAGSSADLVATARATANALGEAIRPEAIEALLRPIEPSDGVMYDGVVAFDHRRVRLRRMFGRLAPMTVVALDEGGTVDTIEFNRRVKPYRAEALREYSALLADLERALLVQDLARVGRIATRSAELNQALLPKQHFEALRAAAARLGLLGVVVAHSGTVAGLLLEDDDPDYLRTRVAAWRVCMDLAGNAAVYRTLTRTHRPAGRSGP